MSSPLREGNRVEVYEVSIWPGNKVDRSDGEDGRGWRPVLGLVGEYLVLSARRTN